MSRRDFAALLAYIEARRDMPHGWGRHDNDCVSFVAYGVKALTGQHRLDVAPRLRWSSKASALRLLARHGGIEAMIDARFVAIAPAMAMRGDIAAIADDELGIHPMLVEGAMLVGPGEHGQRRLPRSRMIRAWSATEKLP